MRKNWSNNGEPDEEGFYEVAIENREGKAISRYKAKSMRDIADLALDSQVQANRQIGRLMQPDRGRTAVKLEPHELNGGDTLRIAQKLDDPDPTARVNAVNEIIDARLGGKPEAVASVVNDISQERSDAYYRAEAEAFVTAHPEYYPVNENQDLLFRELMTRKIDLTRNNLEIVYHALTERGEIIPWPDEAGGESTPPESEEGGGGGNHPPPATRPRRVQSIATGIRNQDSNGSRPAPTTKKTVTRAEIENMSRAEYMDRLRDPGFRRAVDAMA